jgi:hypothetical protein
MVNGRRAVRRVCNERMRARPTPHPSRARSIAPLLHGRQPLGALPSCQRSVCGLIWSGQTARCVIKRVREHQTAGMTRAWGALLELSALYGCGGRRRHGWHALPASKQRWRGPGGLLPGRAKGVKITTSGQQGPADGTVGELASLAL